MPISRLSAACRVDLELRPLPSAGVARRQRYYGPIRHPEWPGRSLAGVRLRVTRPHHLGFPVFRWISVYRHAVVIAPVAHWVGSLVGRPIPPVSLLASGCGLPRLVAGSASTSVISRPARRSLALRPACSPHGQKPRVYLEGSDGFVTSTAAPIATGWSDPVARRESHPLKILDLARRTTWSDPDAPPFSLTPIFSHRLQDAIDPARALEPEKNIGPRLSR
jgi:hypothetical protein